MVDANGVGLSDVVSVSAGSAHTVFLKSNGTVWATGHNNHGQLGDGTTSDSNSSVQVLDADGNVLNGVIAVSAGKDYSIFLKRDGTVWATGSNTNGQLGDGTITNRTTPVQVLDAEGNVLNGVITVSAGSYHSVYLKRMAQFGQPEKTITVNLGMVPPQTAINLFKYWMPMGTN